MKILILLLTFFGAIYGGSTAHADDVYTFIVKKDEQKEPSKWSLDEWLATRNRMRLMDMWLAIHTPTPYEFSIAGDYRSYSLPSSTGGGSFTAQAFASIFGLGFQNEISNDNRFYGYFQLRVFGFQDQGTNITLQTGLREVNSGFGYRNAFLGASTRIYFKRFFAIEGLYRHFFDSTPNASGLTYGGDRYEMGALIDFKVLQVYGNYFIDNDSDTGVLRNGVAIGTRIYF